MPSTKKLLQAAAGNAGGDPLYVEDVFSTYLYTGTGSSNPINNGIALGDTNYGASVEFNGTSDSLTRASDFSGNANANSFTFSCWCFKAVDGVTLRIFTNGQSSGTDSGLVVYAGNNALVFIARDASDVTIFSAYAYTNILPLNVWTNVLISVDLSSASNRYIYMNDVDVTSSFTFSQYTNGYINFTTTTQNIGKADGISSQLWQGKLSSLFLDYTYRDLSVTSNRRLFITADGQPAANQASLNPIMFMPLDDTNAIGKNLGTGGDFTANGPPTALSQGGPYIEAGYGEGGLVWGKRRNLGNSHFLINTVNGIASRLESDGTGAATDKSTSFTSFNSNGFTVATGDNEFNNANGTYASWTFRKAPKFFDIQTWSGNDVQGREISHALGSTPACIICKDLSNSTNWIVYHSGLPGNATKALYLNTTDSAVTASLFWDDTVPTDSVFTIGDFSSINASGRNYVAYIFASDAGGYGDDGDENIIKCGLFTEENADVAVDVGFEPQWLITKRLDGTGDWNIYDNMRGFPADPSTVTYLSANLNAAETTNQFSFARVTSSGFIWKYGSSANNAQYIYIAIRRPMKTPTAGTEVFNGDYSNAGFTAGFPVDLAFMKNLYTAVSTDWETGTRLLGATRLATTSTAAEAADSDFVFDSMTGWYTASPPVDNQSWMFKRATGFMDVIAYRGNESGTFQAVPHNLTVIPELVMIKPRNTGDAWQGGSQFGATQYAFMAFNSSNGYGLRNYNSGYGDYYSAPTSTAVNVLGSLRDENTDFVGYLFATLAGVSKVGTYTGTGANLNVDCGFTGGARFILIKRTDSSGDWYVYDSILGISVGSSPYLLLNSTAAQVSGTGYIDPLNAGFTVTSSAPVGLNASSGNYIFLAIA